MKPARLLLAVAFGWFLFGIAAAVWPLLELAWVIVGGILLAVLLLDLLLLVNAPEFSARRSVASSLPVGVWSQGHLRIGNSGRRTWRMTLFDHYPQQSEAEGLPQRIRVSAGGFAEISYRLRPLERGDQNFGLDRKSVV